MVAIIILLSCLQPLLPPHDVHLALYWARDDDRDLNLALLLNLDLGSTEILDGVNIGPSAGDDAASANVAGWDRNVTTNSQQSRRGLVISVRLYLCLRIEETLAEVWKKGCRHFVFRNSASTWCSLVLMVLTSWTWDFWILSMMRLWLALTSSSLFNSFLMELLTCHIHFCHYSLCKPRVRWLVTPTLMLNIAPPTVHHVSVHDTAVCLIIHFPVCRCIRRSVTRSWLLMQGTDPSASVPRNSLFAFSFASWRNEDKRSPRMMTFTYVPGDGFMLDVSATAIAPTDSTQCILFHSI